MRDADETSLPKRMLCARAERSLRIAVVYGRLPFPMTRGDQLTVAHLISFLHARGHQVDFYTLDLDGALEAAQSEWLETACRAVHIYGQSGLARFAGLFKALARRLPFQVGIFDNARLTADLHAAIGNGAYDIVYCYYLRSAPAIPELVGTGQSGRTRSFLAMQLSQTLNARRIRDSEMNPIKRLVWSVEARRLARYEARVWRRFHRAVLIGPADVEMVKRTCRDEGLPEIDNWIYGAHGTDTDRFIPAEAHELVPARIVFSGGMQYRPNIQAVLWFVQNCWQQVRAAIPEAELVIQGRTPAPEIQRLHGEAGIVVTGSVPDVGEMIRSAAVCVNPMLAAGGMQNKLIEYMACGKAVVATSIANEGVRAPEDTLVIADTPVAFARAVIELCADPERAWELGQRARAYVQENWTWEKHFLDLEREFCAELDN